MKINIVEVATKIQVLQRDLEYVTGLREKMAGKAERFPMIFNGVVRQVEHLQRRVDELRKLYVDVKDDTLLEGTSTNGGVLDAEADAREAEPVAPVAAKAPEEIALPSGTEEVVVGAINVEDALELPDLDDGTLPTVEERDADGRDAPPPTGPLRLGASKRPTSRRGR